MRAWVAWVWVVAACGGGASTGDAAVDDGAIDAASWCPTAETALTGGVACAIAPSATHPSASDAFGYHAVGLPESSNADTPLYVFFKGTGSRPYDATTSQYLGSTLRTLQEAIDHGRIGLVIAYDNVPGLDMICGDDLDCYGAVRIEILEGIEANDPGDTKHVRPPDDVMSRIANLLAYVDAKLPGRVPLAINWATTRLAGGSQGGGHAAFIAKQLHAVTWACNLAGLGDSSAAAMPATWVTTSEWKTPSTRMRAVIHEQDQYFARTTATWNAFGYQLDVNWRTLTAATTDPHNFVVSDDPVAVAARLWACFE